MSGLQILLTGAGGLIGHYLCHRLLAGKNQVFTLSRSAKPALLQPYIDNPDLTVVRGDVRDKTFLSEFFVSTRVDVVFHMAVERYFPNGNEKSSPVLLRDTIAYQTNFEGTMNVLQAAQGRVKAWIQSSAMMVYDIHRPDYLPVDEHCPAAPVEPNGMSVHLAEEACRYFGRVSGLPYIILRYPGVYGRGKERGVVAKFVRHCLSGDSRALEAPANKEADFLYAEDAANANLLAMEKLINRPSMQMSAEYSATYHIGSGKTTSIAALAKIVRVETGAEVEIIEQESPDPSRFYFDISSARKELGFQPRRVEEGIAGYIAEMKNQIANAGGPVSSSE